MSFASSISRCDFTNLTIKCPSSNPEPKCKNPLANPSSLVGFDPTGCDSITGTNVQDAMDQLCAANNQAVSACNIAVQAVGVTTTPVQLTLTPQQRAFLGTNITIESNNVVIGETGTFYIAANVFADIDGVTTPGEYHLNLQQGNTGTSSNERCFYSGAVGITGGETLASQTLVCVTDVGATTGNNVFGLYVTSSGVFVGTVNMGPTSISVLKVSDDVCS